MRQSRSLSSWSLLAAESRGSVMHNRVGSVQLGLDNWSVCVFRVVAGG